MDFGFTEEQEALRKSAREVLADRSTSAVVRGVMESTDGFDAGLWKTIADLGWQGVAIPEEEGGLGLGWVELCILLEEAGYAVLPAPFVSGIGLALPVVLGAEPSAERSRLLQAIASGEARVTAALGEQGSEVTVVADGGGFRLSGTLPFVPDAQVADEIIVLANVDGAPAAFAVPASDAGVTQMTTLDATRRLCEVRLVDVRVDAARRLALSHASLRGALDRAAVALAAEQVGVAQRAMDMSVAYAKEREQFGKPIGSFQAVSHKLAEMLLVTESARSSVYFAAWTLDEGTPDAPLASASARVAGIQAARYATAEGIQVHGGIGFTWEHDLHLLFRRAKWDELYLGDESQWRERIAELLAG